VNSSEQQQQQRTKMFYRYAQRKSEAVFIVIGPRIYMRNFPFIKEQQQRARGRRRSDKRHSEQSIHERMKKIFF